MTVNDRSLIFKNIEIKKNVEKEFDEDLDKRFQNTYKFCDEDLNKYFLMLRKVWFHMYSWQIFNETALSG